MQKNEEIKIIAYYLPQYHPTPENDAWWGKGFTEWTNVAKARPLFKGHYQPRFPADLGYYDLRVPEIREEQAKLARDHGVHGFCYYHYWFGNGKQLLERPFNEILSSGKPDFPFMLCWANQTWKGVWFGASKGKTLIEQTYPGKADYINHFNYLTKVFTDKRYITIEGKPVFHVYMPLDIPDLPLFVDTFRECAYKAGLNGIYLLATNCSKGWNPLEHGFDGVIPNDFHHLRKNAAQRFIKDRDSFLGKVESKVRIIFGYKQIERRNKPVVIPYHKAIELISDWKKTNYDSFPLVLPDWDNSPRAGSSSLILKGSTPELWKIHLSNAIDFVKSKDDQRQLIFVKSWNEWAESNYLEPDQRWGKSYLEVISDLLKKKGAINV